MEQRLQDQLKFEVDIDLLTKCETYCDKDDEYGELELDSGGGLNNNESSLKTENVREAENPPIPNPDNPPGGGEAENGSAKSGKKKAGSEKVICDECGVSIALYSMKSHKLFLHTPNLTTSKCPHCPLEFKKKTSLWEHVTSKHANSMDGETMNDNGSTGSQGISPDDDSRVKVKGMCCSECGQVFANAQSLLRHEYFVHGEGTKAENKLLCPHCSKGFKQKATLDDHIRRVHEGKGYFCDLCPSRGDLQSAAKVWKHKVDYHGLIDLPPPGNTKVIQCEFCGEKMLRGLEAHTRKQHPNVDISQIKKGPKDKEVEAKQSERKRNWALDMQQQVECPHCGKVLTKSCLKRHLKNIHGIGKVKLHPCPHCDRAFRLGYCLTQHIRNFHERTQVDEALTSLDFIEYADNVSINPLGGKGPFCAFCLICDSILGNKCDTRTHLAVEHLLIYQSLKTGVTPPTTLIQCKACPAKFPNMELRNHMEVNHAERCWKCPKCRKVMLSSNELAFHFKYHHRTVIKKKRVRIYKSKKSKTVVDEDHVGIKADQKVKRRRRIGSEKRSSKKPTKVADPKRSTRKRRIKEVYQSSSPISNSDEENSSRNEFVPGLIIKQEIELKNARIHLVRLTHEEILMYTQSSNT